MARFIINGRRKLSGVFQPAGNKNAVLPMLAACLLTDAEIELRNVPFIEDVRTMLAILSELGVAISQKHHVLRLCAKGVRRQSLNKLLCGKARSSILFAGPLAARHGRATLYPPGGDVIGRRRLDTHLTGLRALGIEVSGGAKFAFHRRQLRGAKILLDEASVTATENIMMAATLAKGVTTLWNSACEPHVQDLGNLLNKMGARISGLGSNRLRIQGVKNLHGAIHEVAPDHIEIGSFIVACAVTGGNLTVASVKHDDLLPVLRPFRTLGLNLRFNEKNLALNSRGGLRVRYDFGLAVPKIEDGPWPNFPSDLISVAIVAGTQSRGTTLFFEKMFESRMYFVDRLIDMGAKLVQCDPHRVVVIGPSCLRAIPVHSPDIRAGMALLIAALCAKGQSIISNAEVIDRGYERIEERLRALGADIVRET